MQTAGLLEVTEGIPLPPLDTEAVNPLSPKVTPFGRFEMLGVPGESNPSAGADDTPTETTSAAAPNKAMSPLRNLMDVPSLNPSPNLWEDPR